DRPLSDPIPQLNIARIESPHETHLHHPQPCSLFETEDLLTFRHGWRERLLAKNRLAHADIRNDIPRMRSVVRGDDHCVHLRRLNEVLSRRKRSDAGNARGDHFSTVQVDISDSTDFRSRDRCRNSLNVIGSHDSGANYSYTYIHLWCAHSWVSACGQTNFNFIHNCMLCAFYCRRDENHSHNAPGYPDKRDLPKGRRRRAVAQRRRTARQAPSRRSVAPEARRRTKAKPHDALRLHS